MTDVERLRGEAQKAQADADAAARRAAAAATQAEVALQRAYQEQAAKRRAWAQGVVDAYDTDLAAAERAVQEAQERFATAAVQDPVAATSAYIAWAETSIRHYTLQVRLASVAPTLGLSATPAEHLGPPPFSQALDWALNRHVAALSDRERDKAAAEIQAMLDDSPSFGNEVDNAAGGQPMASAQGADSAPI